ncbi:MAG: glycoside hydrolase family 172 protein, partial [Candidatus Hinthialibacter sp.]
TGNVEKIHFYQIQMRLYDEGAEVKTFQPSDLTAYQQDFAAVQKILKNPDANWIYASAEAPIEMAAVVAPGESKEMLFQKGPKAVERLTLKVHAADLDAALRQTILEIHFDEHPWGQVQSPLGDFFGAAPGINPFDSVPFTVKPDGEMTCRFVMPFKQSVRIMLINQGERPVSVSGSARLSEYEWSDESSMHFRARWRVDHDLVASNNRVQDLPFLLANGRGVYVGTSSMLLNPNEIPSSYGNWWGEGDEKIFVDDDAQPSTFGTGSEDYYNYAWSSEEIFVHPYFGQPRNDGPANRGFVTNHRWHILDPLPFQYRLSFYMELFSHEETPGVSYARLSYLYGKPGMMDDHLPITGEDVRLLELPQNWQPVSKMGAMNSIFFGAEDLAAPSAGVELAYDNLWQGGALMVWRPAVEGGTLDLPFSLKEEGEYAIRLITARTPASGKITVLLDGAPLDLGGVIDLSTDYRTLLRATPPSPKMKLEKGEHTITLRFEGKSGADSCGEIGLDCVWLQR